MRRKAAHSLSLVLFLFALWGLGHPEAQADPVVSAENGLSCAGERAEKYLGCSANDFTTSITITNATSESCVEGGYMMLDGQVTMESSGPNRYNIGFFAGENQNDPQAETGGQCSVATFPTGPDPWMDYDGDACGDFKANSLSTPTVNNLRVLCTGDDSGTLEIPYVVTWEQNGGSCTGPFDVQPGTQSKCIGGMATVTNVVVTPRPLADYRFEEASWDGTNGEVGDSSGNGLEGTAYGDATTADAEPAIPDTPGSCRYGVFDGDGDYIQVADNGELSGSDQLTYTAWINPAGWSGGIHQVMGKSLHAGGSGPAQMGIFSEDGQLKGRAETNIGRIEVSTALPATDEWTHVALTFEVSSNLVQSTGTLTLYVGDEESQASKSQLLSVVLGGVRLESNSDPLTIGSDYDRSYFFNGFIDEARVYATALNASQIAAVRSETHPCQAGAVLDHFELSSSTGDSGSICSPTNLTVKACADYACTIPYTGGVTGTMIASGTADVSWTGGASFTIPAGSSTVEKEVQVETPESVVFGATSQEIASPTTCDFGSPNCSFTASGTSFLVSAEDHSSETDGELRIEAVDCSTGSPPNGFTNTSQTINLKCDYVDPSSGTLPLRVEGSALNSANDSTAVCDSTGADFSLSFDANGVTSPLPLLRYADVGRMSVTASYEKNPGKGQLAMTGTGTFVVKPHHFALDAIQCEDGTLNPAASGPNDGIFCRSGQPFSVTVAAKNAAGNETPNYGRESTPEGVALMKTLVSPLDCNGNPADDPDCHDPGLAGSFGDFQKNCEGDPAAAGTACGTFHWPEVGIVQLTPRIGDGDYLGGGDVVGTASGNIGRFYADHFDLDLSIANFAPANVSFTYLGEPFVYDTAPALTITARSTPSSGSVRLQNYQGDYWKLGTSIPQGTSCNHCFTYTDEAGNADSTLSLSPADNIEFGDISNAGGAHLVGAVHELTDFQYSRPADPIAPFDSDVKLEIFTRDSDGAVGSTEQRYIGFNGDTDTGSVSPLNTTNDRLLRWGRAVLADTFGQSGQELAMPLYTEFYDGSHFVKNSDDITTSVDANGGTTCASTDFGCVTDGSASDVTVTGVGITPDDYFKLTPVSSVKGNATLTLTTPAWLTFDWDDDGSEDFASGTATFGIYRGDDRFYYWREAR